MTEQYQTPQHAPVKKKPWFTKPIVLAPAAALVAGLAIGAAGGSDAGAAEPVPAPTVTVTAKPEVKTVTVEKTPAACIKAIDLSQQGFTYSAEAMGYLSDALTAAGNFNVAGLTTANEKLTVLNPKIKALTSPMQSAVAECRAKG